MRAPPVRQRRGAVQSGMCDVAQQLGGTCEVAAGAPGVGPFKGLPLRGLPLRGLLLRGLPLRGLPLRGTASQGAAAQGAAWSRRFLERLKDFGDGVPEEAQRVRTRASQHALRGGRLAITNPGSFLGPEAPGTVQLSAHCRRGWRGLPLAVSAQEWPANQTGLLCGSSSGSSAACVPGTIVVLGRSSAGALRQLPVAVGDDFL